MASEPELQTIIALLEEICDGQRLQPERQAEAFARQADLVVAQRERLANAESIRDRADQVLTTKLWMWDGEFCGAIGLRWQPGTSELPVHVLGHVGYSVVPWKRRRGHATAALGLMLRRARREALRYVEITTDVDNVASQKVVRRNGGAFVERFRKPPQYGANEGLRFRIAL